MLNHQLPLDEWAAMQNMAPRGYVDVASVVQASGDQFHGVRLGSIAGDCRRLGPSSETNFGNRRFIHRLHKNVICFKDLRH
jgi:hypothetical protein